MPKPRTDYESWYDYPQYYDMVFREETDDEVGFVEAASKKFCDFPVRRLLEPACGTGRLTTELAARGYSVTGLDLSDPSLAYLRRRLKRRGLEAELVKADMSDFRFPRPFDAAYCLLNSFRHLLTEESARRHLECVAQSLRPGGIYLLGLHLLPPDADDHCIERWTAKQGVTRVTATLRVLATDRRRRLESLRISTLVRKGENVLRLRNEFQLRIYTAAQIKRLFASVPSFTLCGVYDFWYDLNDPRRLDNEISDSVFVLRCNRRERAPG